MAGTTNGAAKRTRRKDGTFEKIPLRERMRNLSVEKKRAMRFLPSTPKSIIQAQHVQPAQLPPNNGSPAVLPAWTFSGFISSYAHVFRNPDEAVRHSKENARNMRNDCSVMECLEARQRAVELLNWHIKPEDEKDARQVKACTILTRLLKKTPNFKKYRHALLEAVWYGRYAVNQEWRFCFDEGKRRAIISKWWPLNGDKLVFGFDDDSGSFAGADDRVGIKVTRATFRGNVDQIQTGPEGDVYFLEPWERACLAIHKHIVEDAAFEDPYASGSLHGVGIRSRIYWTWFQMQEALAMLIEFLERVGLGITIYYYPAGDEAARASVEEIAKNQRQNNYLLMPRVNGDPALDAYGVERVEPNAGGAQVLQDAIVMLFAHRIKRYILGQTLTTESEGAGLGSSGISDLHKWGFFQIIKSDAIDLEETMTREVLKNLVDFNIPEASQWDLRFVIDTEAPDVQGQLEAYEKAFNMGLGIVEDDVYDLIGASKPDGNQKVLSLSQLNQASAAMAGAGIGGNLGGQPVGTSSGGKFGEKIDGGGDGDEDSETIDGEPWYSDKLRKAGLLERYEKDAGTWITIGSKTGSDGKKHGGTPVLIRGGKIVSGPPALRGQTLKGITNQDESDSRLGSAIAKVAGEHRIKRSILKEAADFVWKEKREAIEMRERAKAIVRKSAGLSQADFNRLSNSGKDYTSIPHFDEIAQEAAREHPELGLGDPDDKGADLAAALWDLLAEGKVDAPARHSEEILEEAVAVVKSARRYKPDDDLEDVPFSAKTAGSAERYVVYCRGLDEIRLAIGDE